MLKAFDEKDSRGRKYPLESDLLLDCLPPFDRDFEMISSSKALRRLLGKTQVFKATKNPHVRTRRTHTDEVRQISRIISSKLGLNTSLCQAIALGHDLGHTPYGHLGERIIGELSGKEFRHNIFSVIIAQEIEKKGMGLNLSYETLEGMLLHSRGSGETKTSGKLNEYDVVMFADKIGYTFADINDAIRYDVINEKDVPKIVYELGENQSQRIDSCIRALVTESLNEGRVSFSKSKVAQYFKDIKDYMYSDVYHKIDDDLHEQILISAYRTLEREYPEINTGIGLALLTDWEVDSIGQVILNSQKPTKKDFENFGFKEIVPYISNRNIDYANPRLDWGKK